MAQSIEKIHKLVVIFLKFLKNRFKVIKLDIFVFPAMILVLGMVFVSSVIGSGSADPYPELYASKPASNEEKTEPEKAVYITFDDGPSAVTEEILEILSEEGIKATFFVIGPNGENTDRRLLRIYEEGHTIGVHSWSHEYSEIYTSVDSFLKDFSVDREWIYSVTGEYCDIFRFPGGSGNSAADKYVMNDIAEEMERRGFVWYDWNADGEDSIHKYISAWEIAQNVFESAEGKDKVVVLLHDSSTRKTTPEALRLIIQKFKDMGYEFGVLTDMAEPIQQNRK